MNISPFDAIFTKRSIEEGEKDNLKKIQVHITSIIASQSNKRIFMF